MWPNARLQHVEAGAVSISRDGSEVGISLGRSLVMDNTHQVRGALPLLVFALGVSEGRCASASHWLGAVARVKLGFKTRPCWSAQAWKGALAWSAGG